MTSFLSRTSGVVAFGAWWFSWTELHFIVLNNFHTPFNIAITDAVLSNALLAATGLVIYMNLRFYTPRKEKFWYVFIISLVLSIMWVFLCKFILSSLFNDNSDYLDLLNASMIIRFGIAFLITGCMAMLSMLWFTNQEQKEIDKRKTEAEQLARDAELFKLRQQLQPHFLFNSLNSISALTGSQPEKARHMIQQLSDFLRGTLKKDEGSWNSLQEELQHLQLYLDIEKVRFGYRLQTSIEHDEEVLQMKLPSLLLQPAVENAIKFGLYDTTGEVLISIVAKKINQSLQVTVTNPYDAETSQPLQGTGFGLASIRRRLFLLFARQDLLVTKTEENNFITTITIPQLQ